MQSRALGRPQDKLWASPQTSPVSLPCHVSLDHSSGLFRAHGALSDRNDSALAPVTIWSQTSHQPVSLAGSPALPRSGCSALLFTAFVGQRPFPNVRELFPVGDLCRRTGCEHRQPPRANGAGVGGGGVCFLYFSCFPLPDVVLEIPSNSTPSRRGFPGPDRSRSRQMSPGQGSLRGGQQVDGNAGLPTEQVLFG